MHVFILAGEASGDAIGAKLIQALKAKKNDIKFTGIAGQGMLNAGCQTLFPQSDISLMGLAEILPHIKTLKKRLNQTVQAILEQQPDLVITIDAPGFNTRVVKELKKHPKRPKMIHYVAPSVWAWKPNRADIFAELFDGLLCLLPFEPQYFPKLKKTYYVGHPVLESGADKGNGAQFRQQYDIHGNVLAMLLGSRAGELKRLLPVYKATAQLLSPDLTIAMPIVPHLVTDALLEELQSWPQRVVAITEPQQKYDLMAASDAAIAASGTVTLELAMAGVPTTVAYKINPLTYQIVKNMVRLKYVSLINILRDEMIMPEYLQAECTPENLANNTQRFLKQDGAASQYYKAEVSKTMQALIPENGKLPSEAAADIIIHKF